MKRRSISLIEVIICLTLFSFLLSTLFFWYRSFSKQKETFQQLKWPLMEERYAFQRLQTMIPSAQSPLFSADAESGLVFIFNRGAWQDPELSDTVLARLYLDTQHASLCLGIWPDPTKDEEPTRSPSQTMVLLEGVTQLSFKFYCPPNPFKKPVDPEEVGNPRPKERWQSNWQADYHKLPALVKVIITRKSCTSLDERTIKYTFDLPETIVIPKSLGAK